MNEQQNLTLHLGMSNVPSDAACNDNALEESLGMLYDNGEHRPIQTPVLFASINHSQLIESGTVFTRKLLYVHRFNNITRYFVAVRYVQSGSQVTYYHIAVGTKDGDTIRLTNWLWDFFDGDYSGSLSSSDRFAYTEGTKISSVGKTVVIANESGMNYFIWKADYYVGSGSTRTLRMYAYKGNRIPIPQIDFRLADRNGYYAEEEIGITGIVYSNNGYPSIVGGKQNDWNNAVVGLYSKLRKELWHEKRFQGSFCVRAALKMIDGTYYTPTNPILMLNHLSAQGTGRIDGSMVFLTMKEYGQRLEYKLQTDYSDWNDIVENVTIFVTREANIYDTTADAVIENATQPAAFYVNTNKLYTDTRDVFSQYYRVLKPVQDADLKKLVEEGNYYRLCDIGIKASDDWKSTDKLIDSNTLENITTQDQLVGGDYHSYSEYIPGLIFPYNSRLSLANVYRGFFDGFGKFMPYVQGYPHSDVTDKAYKCYVTIHTDNGDYVVCQDVTTKDKLGVWFYYPDSRASHVTIVRKDGNTDTFILDADLKEHPTLSGAYYFQGIEIVNPSQGVFDLQFPTVSGATIPDVTSNPKEYLPNTVITSDVNDPFVFQAEGYDNVGNGDIIGMTSNTQALSDGQHGQFPLLVFTTEGIWALGVTKEGIYADKDPISREVALNGNPCLTQTDNAVFFASKKGLMRVDGSKVTCVSEQLRGFAEILIGAKIAYDYRQSLLHIISDGFTSQGQYVYVYSLANGTFARYNKSLPPFTEVVNAYPDNLLCVQQYVYSLLEVPEEANDDAVYSGVLVSRPIKFGNGLSLKSLRDLKIIRDMQSNASVELTISASNDLRTWKVLKSFRGIPYKYFKVCLSLTGMKATDRLAGIATIVQERRTNKLR